MARFDFGDNLMKVRLDQRKKPGTFLLDQCATAVLSYLLVAIAAALAAGRRVRSSQGPRPEPAAPLLPLLGPKNLSHFFAAITFLSARSRKSRSGVTRVRARAFSRRTATTHVFLRDGLENPGRVPTAWQRCSNVYVTPIFLHFVLPNLRCVKRVNVHRNRCRFFQNRNVSTWKRNRSGAIPNLQRHEESATMQFPIEKLYQHGSKSIC
jgi:hypothetical protein